MASLTDKANPVDWMLPGESTGATPLSFCFNNLTDAHEMFLSNDSTRFILSLSAESNLCTPLLSCSTPTCSPIPRALGIQGREWPIQPWRDRRECQDSVLWMETMCSAGRGAAGPKVTQPNLIGTHLLHVNWPPRLSGSQCWARTPGPFLFSPLCPPPLPSSHLYSSQLLKQGSYWLWNLERESSLPHLAVSEESRGVYRPDPSSAKAVGRRVASPNICPGPNTQTLWTWHYLEKGSLQMGLS